MRYVSFAEVVPTTRVLRSGDSAGSVAVSSSCVSLRFFGRAGKGVVGSGTSVDPALASFLGDALLASIDARRLFSGCEPSMRPCGIPGFLEADSEHSDVRSMDTLSLSSASTIALILAFPASPTRAKPPDGSSDVILLSICNWPSSSCVMPIIVGRPGYANAKDSSLSSGQASTATPTSCAVLNATQSEVAGKPATA